MVVERALGVGSWPVPEQRDGGLRSAELDLAGPGGLLALLVSLEGLIEIRSPWRTWRTVVDGLAPAVAELDTVTVEAMVVDGSARRKVS